MRDRFRLPSFGPFALVFALVSILCVTASANDWTDDDPSRTSAGEIEDHQATSSDPSDHEAHSHEMDEGHAEDLEDHMAGTEDLEDHVVEAEDLEEHEGTTTALQDLRYEAPDDGLDPIDDGRLDRIDDEHLDAGQLVAKRHLARAQEEAAAARSVYGDMIRDNYPRGAARIRIIERRDATMADLEQAREEFDEAMGN
jgi:hypothetical protein